MTPLLDTVSGYPPGSRYWQLLPPVTFLGTSGAVPWEVGSVISRHASSPLCQIFPVPGMCLQPVTWFSINGGVRQECCTRCVQLHHWPSDQRICTHVKGVQLGSHIPTSAKAGAASEILWLLHDCRPNFRVHSKLFLVISTMLCWTVPWLLFNRPYHNLVYVWPHYTTLSRCRQFLHEPSGDGLHCRKRLSESALAPRTHCITDYLNFCVDVVTPAKTVQPYPNSKLWITQDVKVVLKKKKKAFRTGGDKKGGQTWPKVDQGLI